MVALVLRKVLAEVEPRTPVAAVAVVEGEQRIVDDVDDGGGSARSTGVELLQLAAEVGALLNSTDLESRNEWGLDEPGVRTLLLLSKRTYAFHGVVVLSARSKSLDKILLMTLSCRVVVGQ